MGGGNATSSVTLSSPQTSTENLANQSTQSSDSSTSSSDHNEVAPASELNSDTATANVTSTTDSSTTSSNSNNNVANVHVRVRRAAVATDTTNYDVDDIYNYYSSNRSTSSDPISKQKIQDLIDYKNNMSSVTAILNLDATSYGVAWVDQALNKDLADPNTLTDIRIGKIITTYGNQLVTATNNKIDEQLTKLTELQQQYPNSEEVKNAIDKLNEAKNQVTLENIYNAEKMEEVIDTLNKYGSPNAYDELAKKAEENPNGNNQALDEEKQKANDAIDKLNNLNDEQKAAAKAAVNNATDAAGVTAASDKATALDGNMGNLKESVADVDTTKASGNYKNANEEVQKAYDAAVEAANAIVAKKGANADSEAVQAALEEVKAAKDALNGDSKLANAKQAAQDAIDKLNNLNEAQKAAAKAAIEQASSLAEISTASDKATNLDSSMGDLKKASIDSESIKNNVEYVNASADKQKAFDDAMKAASDVLNGKQADYKTVLDLIISLSNAKDNLDGAKNFNNSKQVAKDVIDNLVNLNDAQKVTAKKEIDSATQENAITTAVNKAKNLDDLMIKLHAAIEVAAQTRVTVRYLNASPELREAYDKVVKLSKEVVTKNGNDANANDIQLLLQALETAQNALNGKEIVVTPDSSQSNQTDSNSDNKLENKTANPSKATATAKNKVSTSEKLPQTGDTSDNNVSIIGATLASIAGLFGLGSLYKKKEDK